MVSRIALDEILGVFFSSVVRVALESHAGNGFLHDRAADATCLRIPCDVVAAFERLGHLPVATESKMHPATQWSGGKRYLRCLQTHAEDRVRA